MHITIYVNKKNAELFKNETEKSRLINNLLERHYFDTADGGKTQADVHAELDTTIGLTLPPVAKKPPVIQNLADVVKEEEIEMYYKPGVRPAPEKLAEILTTEEDEWAFLEGLVYQRANRRVYYTDSREPYDEAVDKAMIDELIRRKQVI